MTLPHSYSHIFQSRTHGAYFALMKSTIFQKIICISYHRWTVFRTIFFLSVLYIGTVNQAKESNQMFSDGPALTVLIFFFFLFFIVFTTLR